MSKSKIEQRTRCKLSLQWGEMAVEEFQFKIAKSKDLPLSWFELVLCPEKFREHLKTLETNPNVDPTALQLIVTFLEKAGCIEGQPPPAENSSIAKDKKKTLVDCALFIASHLQWNLATLKSLPAAVQCTLVCLLSDAFPLRRHTDPDSPLTSEDPPNLTAHVICNQWLLRFMVHSCNLPENPPQGNTWEVTCATPEQIKNLVEPKVSQSVAFLTEVCSQSDSLRGHFQLPCVSLHLPVLTSRGTGERGGGGGGGGEVGLIQLELLKELSPDQQFCQLWYDLGSLHFKNGDHPKALSAFSKARELLSHLASPPSLLDQPKLRGYISACKCVMRRRREGGDEEEVEGTEEEDKGEKTLMERVEELRIGDHESLVDVILTDNTELKLSAPFRTILEIQASNWSDSVVSMEIEEPAAKRPRLEHPGFPEVPIQDRLCLCNAVRNVLEGRSINPHFWQLLTQEDHRQHLQFTLHLCSKVLHQRPKIGEHQLQCLQTFVRTVYGTVPNALEECEGCDLEDLVIPQGFEKHGHDLGASSVMALNCQWGDTKGTARLERWISQSVSTTELVNTVDQLFKGIPPSEHRTAAVRWVGQGRGFATLDSISDPLLLTKYNALLHRAQLLGKAEFYSASVEFYYAAAKLLSPPAIPAKVRQQLELPLHEQILILELKVVAEELGEGLAEELREELKGGVAPDRVTSKHSALVERVKLYYKQSQRDSSLDPLAVQIASAFLLNTQQYSYLVTQDQPPEPGKVAPRLAAAVLNMKEGGDLRRPTRLLFEAVLSVFSPPLSTSERRVEQSEKQSKLRAYLDVFVENLMDATSLSFLLAALARIWNLLKKPEDEILSEFSNYWPTAIGNPGSVDTSHVFRSLSSTLTRALMLKPNKSSWVIMRADVNNATCRYGAALESYLEGGALDSTHFEEEVPPQVWSQEVYRRIIGCCSRIGYHTHAVVFCQFLQPVDYELAFSILKNHSSAAMESLFDYLWDMGIIEYLIYIHSKRGDTHKQSVATQVAGQPELNANNSSEVLSRAVQVRRRRFLRTFYKQLILV